MLSGIYCYKFLILRLIRDHKIHSFCHLAAKNYTEMITTRSEATAVDHQGMLIITGGEDDKGNLLSSTELFNSNIGQWYLCSDLPQQHRWLQSAIVDNILYLLGGFNKNGNTCHRVFIDPLDTLSIYQLKWNTHQDIYSMASLYSCKY